MVHTVSCQEYEIIAVKLGNTHIAVASVTLTAAPRHMRTILEILESRCRNRLILMGALNARNIEGDTTKNSKGTKLAQWAGSKK